MKRRFVLWLTMFVVTYPAIVSWGYINGVPGGRQEWQRMSGDEKRAYEKGGWRAVERMRGGQRTSASGTSPSINNNSRPAAPALELNVPVLIDALKSSDPRLRHTAAYRLREAGETGKWGVPMLIQVLRDPDSDVRWVASGTLGYLGKDAVDALPALRRLGDDPNLQVRKSAAQAVQKIESAIMKVESKPAGP